MKLVLYSIRTFCRAIEETLNFQIVGKSAAVLVAIKMKSFKMAYITCCECRNGLAYMFNGFTCGVASGQPPSLNAEL